MQIFSSVVEYLVFLEHYSYTTFGNIVSDSKKFDDYCIIVPYPGCDF